MMNFDACLANLAIDQANADVYEIALKHIFDCSNSVKQSGMMSKLKRVCGIGITDIKRDLKCLKPLQQSMSHYDIAQSYLNSLEIKPVGVYGKIWFYSEQKKIWVDRELDSLQQDIAQMFNNEKRCQKANDYSAIARLIYSIQLKPKFFDGAPVGFNTPDQFYFVDGKKIVGEPHKPEHKARFMVTCELDITNPPKLLLKVLGEAFLPDTANDQIRLLRMTTGLAIFGKLHELQRCLLLYGVPQSFKSGFGKLIRQLVPDHCYCNVSPLEMDQDYKKAALSGKLLNFVPELDGDRVVPAADFKAITGGDLISARLPGGIPFSYVCNSGHIFNSNFYLNTRDNSDGFFRRWLIIHFQVPTPLEKVIPDLDKIIANEEMAHVLGWCFNGMQDYLDNGLQLSQAHDDCIAEWKLDSNAVLAWLNDDQVKRRDRGDRNTSPLSLKEAYAKYKEWSLEEGYSKPFCQKKFKELLGHAGLYTAKSRQVGGKQVYLELIGLYKTKANEGEFND